MDPIPDCWPPDESARPVIEAPVFPLPAAFLFPGQVMALNVFEPRYRAMIEDCLDGPGRIVINAVESTAGRPPLREIAGLGEIARHEKLPDGRFTVWLGGIGRVRVREISSERPYRMVQCELVTEVDPSPSDEASLRDPLMSAIESRVASEIELGEDLPIGLLSDLLSQCISLPTETLGSLFEEPNVTRRAELALSAHQRFPKED
ncbi:MAG: LON peptidase substrate-binding domain-containing protein [Planctomycetes bacterium]|nr:LON peptidase substrate-binding domain-containing protein [Planctomycetota bacterium]